MIELPIEQKRQIIENRRVIVARNKFEFEIDIIVMTARGRTEEVAILNQQIEELAATDLALLELLKTYK